MADIGWVTGHSYIVYGPLSLGCTTFIFESTPLYPTPDRYWRMVERHKFTTFYTAPTAIRACKYQYHYHYIIITMMIIWASSLSSSSLQLAIIITAIIIVIFNILCCCCLCTCYILI